VGLRPAHFALPYTAAAFEAMVALSDRGCDIDPLSVAMELEGDERVADPKALASHISMIPADAITPASYGERVKDLARRRQLKQAAELIDQAAETGDDTKLTEAESLLSSPEEQERSTWTGEQLASRYYDRLEEPAQETWSWPFSKLDRWTGGGLRRQQVVLLGGWTGVGKTVLFDQMMERLAEQGLRCHSYINEMSVDERMDRTMARLTGVPFSKIYARDLQPEQYAKVLTELQNVRVGMTECAGWSAPEIARHIRWNRWDVAGVDILHEIAHREERDLAEIAQVLRSTAKSVGCALICCVHLNDNRVSQAQRPVPVLRDVRGSGMLVRGADIVLFIHRQDDDDGVPGEDGLLSAAKVRNGSPDVMRVRFDAARMRFLPAVEAVPAGAF
jgi:replicative DNA helicase